MDCVIVITPFISKDGKVRNQAYATILKFFEDDVEYATEMINSITEDVGNDAFIEITNFEKELPTLNVSQPKVDDKDNNNEDKDSNIIFRYDEFYKFPQSDKTGKKIYDTLTVRIEDADWYFDRKKWQAGVFSGYVDVVHLENLNQYGIYREDNTLVGCPNSFDFDDEIKDFTEGQRIFCIFMLVPHIDRNNCIEIRGKAVLIKFFEIEEGYAHKLFENTRTRLAKTAIADYQKFTEKKKETEDSGNSVLLSWAFDTRRYTFGDNSTTYLDDYGQPLKSNKGCLTSVVVLSMIFAFSMIGIAVLT